MSTAATMTMSTTANEVVSAFSFISFVLILIPLPWHFQSWNTGTCLFMLWGSLACMNTFINSVIWNKNVMDVAPVWCDISTRITLATNIGIPVASLCINRRLYHISSLKSARITEAEKRRGVFVDLAIGLGLPLFLLPLTYITQARRYDIAEQVGCLPAIYNSFLAYMFIWCPPLVIGIISAFYCGSTIRSFNKRRTQFKASLSNNNVNSGRYFRLMGLASLDLFCTIPIASYIIVQATQNGGYQPWISWKVTHAGFDQPIQIPAIVWRNDPTARANLELSRGLNIACALVFFLFFGFAEEARKNYLSVYSSVAKRVGYSTGSMSSGATSTLGSKTPMTSSFGKGLISFGKASAPVIVRQETTRTTDTDTLSSYKEKPVRISTSSVFDNVDAKAFPSSLSPPSIDSRSPSPTPPRYNSDSTTKVHNTHDIV